MFLGESEVFIKKSDCEQNGKTEVCFELVIFNSTLQK